MAVNVSGSLYFTICKSKDSTFSANEIDLISLTIKRFSPYISLINGIFCLFVKEFTTHEGCLI